MLDFAPTALTVSHPPPDLDGHLIPPGLHVRYAHASYYDRMWVK
jgi:hypothetical protein